MNGAGICNADDSMGHPETSDKLNDWHPGLLMWRGKDRESNTAVLAVGVKIFCCPHECVGKLTHACNMLSSAVHSALQRNVVYGCMVRNPPAGQEGSSQSSIGCACTSILCMHMCLI